MPKASQVLIKHWEDILESEGLGEVSLFDNTGKGHSVRFISTTNEGGNNDWFESVNICENGRVLRFEDHPAAVSSRKLSHDVASLPPTWPSRELELLLLWADTGNFLGSFKGLGLNRLVAWRIRRRFEQFIKDSER